MKKILYISLLLIVMIACSNQSMTEQMNEIDSLVVNEQFDSAYACMLRIDKSKLLKDDDLAHYYLLLTQTSLLTHHSDTMSMLDSLVIPYYVKVSNHEKLAEAYYYKAYMEVLKSQYPEAVLLYKKAEKEAVGSLNLRLKYKIFESLSAINEVCGNYLLQLNYAKKTLATAKEAGNQEWEAYAYHRIFIAHSRLQHEDSALYYINKAIPLIKKVSPSDYPTFLTNAAYTFKYSLPDTAKNYLIESLSHEESSVTIQHLADIYRHEGLLDKAYNLWKRALSINDGVPKDNLLHNLLEYDIEHGNTDHVCETVNEIIHIKDSMLYTLRDDTIKDLQLRFDHEVAMHEQEEITSNWQKGVLVAIIVVLLLSAYIAIKKVLVKNKMQKVQIQINDYMSQIRELEASGEDAGERIEQLNKKIRKYLDNEAPELKIGKMHYDDIAEERIKTLSLAGWKRNDEKIFINYYEAIDYRTVNRLRKVKRKEELTTHRLFFLLLVEMGKSDKYIAELFGINDRSLETLKTRTKPIE